MLRADGRTAGDERCGEARGDRGSATVWAAGAIAALLAVTGLLWALGAAAVTRHRAASAADLAALAAAGHVQDGAVEACGHATRIAERMRVAVRDCRLEQWDALVVVEAEGPGLLAAFGPAVGRARAGPAEPIATSGRAVGERHGAGDRLGAAPATEQRSSAHDERSRSG